MQNKNQQNNRITELKNQIAQKKQKLALIENFLRALREGDELIESEDEESKLNEIQKQIENI